MDKENVKKTANTLRTGAKIVLGLGIALSVFFIWATFDGSSVNIPEELIAVVLQALCCIMIGIFLLLAVGFCYLFVFLSSYLKLKAEKKEND